MHIGFIIYDSLDTVTGAYLYNRHLVEYLESSGDTVEIISIPWGPLHKTIPQNWLSSLSQKLLTTNYDVLIQDEFNHSSLFLLNQRIKSKIDYPIISLVHRVRSREKHSRVRMPIYRFLEHQYLQSVDGFIYNSETTRKTVEEIIGKSKAYVVATPAGNRFDQLPEIRDKQEKTDLRILFVGDIIQRKCLDKLIDSVAYLDVPFEVHVAGRTAVDESYYHTICKKIDSYHLRSKITFLGCLDTEELASQYQWADVLVVPSSYEGFGTVYLEAFKFGVPVIATKAGGIHEVVEHCKSGFLADLGDVTAINQYLHQLYMDRGLLARMSEQAQKRFTMFPSWEVSMSRVKAYMERITLTTPIQIELQKAKQES